MILVNPRCKALLSVTPVALLLSLLVTAGCTTWKPNQTSVDTLAREKTDPSKSLRIQYDSPPGRLAAIGAPSADTLEAPVAAFAAAETCRLSIIYPHPDGLPEMALATVALLPEDFDDEGQSVWNYFGEEEQRQQGPSRTLGAWTLDIPAWQANAVVNKLQEQNFFRRARPLGAEVYLAVKIDEVGFGKDYKPVPELDSLIVRVQKLGRPYGEPAQRISQRTRAAGAASMVSGNVHSPGRLPIAPHLGDGRVYRLPIVR